MFVMTSDAKCDDQVVMLQAFEKRIIEVFEVFDHTGNKTIDVREISTVLCSLGCVPSKKEVQEIIKRIQDPEFHGNVHISKFLPFVSNLIVDYRFHPASAEELLKAFQVLDKDGVGYLTKNYLSEKMIEQGEHFTQEELKEMLSVAVNSEDDRLNKFTVKKKYYTKSKIISTQENTKFLTICSNPSSTE